MDLSKYCTSSSDIGVPVRYDDCPFCKKKIKAKGFVVTRNTKGFVMYCHKCGKSRFIKNTGHVYIPPKTEVIRRVKNIITPPVLDRTQEYVMVPRDTVAEIPIEPLMWLRQYNITDEEISTYNIGWSAVYQRLILPVYSEDGTLIYWQGRYFGEKPNQSKYLNIRSSKGHVLFVTGNADSECLVVVEDIISAIAVSRTGCRALALLGSSLPDYVVEFLLQQSRQHENLQVVVWLDSDKKCSSIEYSNRLGAFNVQSSWVSTPLDPKCYTAEQILQHISKEKSNE